MTSDQPNGATSGDPEAFIDKTIEFPDGSKFERLAPITDFRKDPGEARMLYTCRQVAPDHNNKEFVLKVKAQWPGPQQLIHEGPSPYTAAELKALESYRELNTIGVPHLIKWKRQTQSDAGVHAGGYIIYTIMTKLPGETLWDIGYWSMTEAERDEIRTAFIKKLNELRGLGIQPYDCALRNVLWEKETKQLGIVDFEHYYGPEDTEFDEVGANEGPSGGAYVGAKRWEGSTVSNENEELMRWGLAQRPAPRTWFQEWGLKGY